MAQVRAFRRCFSDSRLQERRHQTRLSNKNAEWSHHTRVHHKRELTHELDPVPEALEEGAGGCDLSSPPVSPEAALAEEHTPHPQGRWRSPSVLGK